MEPSTQYLFNLLNVPGLMLRIESPEDGDRVEHESAGSLSHNVIGL